MIIEKYDVTLIENARPTQGMSAPLIVQDSDFNKYIMKSPTGKNSRGQLVKEDAVFFQECIGYMLAEKLGLHIPKIVALNLSKKMVENNPEIMFQRGQRPGLKFGTSMIDGMESNFVQTTNMKKNLTESRLLSPWIKYFTNVVNVDEFPSIIALDIFLMNLDRFGNNGNLLIANQSGRRIAYSIDYGHSFLGPCYSQMLREKQTILQHAQFQPISNPDNIRHYINVVLKSLLDSAGFGNRLSGIGNVFRAMQSTITFENSINPFIKPIDILTSISDNNFLSMLNTIPDEWVSGGIQQKNYYKQFMLDQQQLLPMLLESIYNNGAFENSLEGSLEWQTNNRASGIQ